MKLCAVETTSKPDTQLLPEEVVERSAYEPITTYEPADDRDSDTEVAVFYNDSINSQEVLYIAWVIVQHEDSAKGLLQVWKKQSAATITDTWCFALLCFTSPHIKPGLRGWRRSLILPAVCQGVVRCQQKVSWQW